MSREFDVVTLTGAEYDELVDELAALKKDAARYRWLRGSPLDRGKCFSFDGLSLKCGADLDAAIDATMGKD